MKLLNDRKIIIFGASKAGETAFNSLAKYQLEVDSFVDNDERKWDTKFCGKNVVSPRYLKNEEKGTFVVFIASSYFNEISELLISEGFIENEDFFGRQREWKSEYPILIKLGDNKVIVNLSDYRVFSLLTKTQSAQQRLENYWNDSVKDYLPDIVIDVGVNYGEAIFSATYQKKTQIYGIEANPKLIPYIEASRLVHPNQHQIKIINSIASEKTETSKCFYIDKKSSGTSSQMKKSNLDDCEIVEIPSVAIDDLFNQVDLEGKKILFKVDVEGFEYEVLLGMKNILNRVSSFQGYIEIDNKFLNENKTSIIGYLDYLYENFSVYIFENGFVNKIDKEYLFSKLNGNETYHTDLILKNR
ncbi:FkbM family methyltransferase [Paenibacillus motobuensis]|uniref:Methyltransferase FkbM domain-containing protein n=1 Tax=Paenibacillus motobuensis TaxID=295324 RepID=A0ABP3HS91_9BACL